MSFWRHSQRASGRASHVAGLREVPVTNLRKGVNCRRFQIPGEITIVGL